MKHLLYMIILSMLTIQGCTNVQAWEKETLASPLMSEAGINPLLNSFEEHIYFSKEASKGGTGVSGGGCGCN